MMIVSAPAIINLFTDNCFRDDLFCWARPIRILTYHNLEIFRIRQEILSLYSHLACDHEAENVTIELLLPCDGRKAKVNMADVVACCERVSAGLNL